MLSFMIAALSRRGAYPTLLSLVSRVSEQPAQRLGRLLPAPRGSHLRIFVHVAVLLTLLAAGVPGLLTGRPVLAPLTASAAPPEVPGNTAVYQLTDPHQSLTFEGKGWGHGVGLCQWGARGRALAGQTAQEIVRAYYAGSTIQQAVAPETTIRVLVHTGLQLAPGEAPRITAAGGRWQVETRAAAGASPPAAIAAPAQGYLELSAEGGPNYTVKDKDGAPLGSGPLNGPLVLRPLEGTTRFTIGYKPAPEAAGQRGVRYDTYRGELIVSPEGDKLETVNRLSLEDYLKGVVPAEMPSSWPVEALKAQTLAARSYAVSQAKGRAGQRYDVDDTIRYQVYHGLHAERPHVNQIITATAGQVILSGGQTIQAFFFSTCAGWTENNEAVWPDGKPLLYLRGLHDVDASGRPYDADSPLFTWTTGSLTVRQLEDILNADATTSIGRLLTLDLSRRTPSGRLLQVIVTGSSGTKMLRPTTLMAQFNRDRPPGVAQLRSTNFDLTGVPYAPVVPPTPMPTPMPMPTPTPQSVHSIPSPAPAGVAAPPSDATAYRLEITNPATPKPDGPASRYFASGHNVGGAFLHLYEQGGGLDRFGYPRTEEIVDDGRTVQYFQRAVFEYHADKAGTPYEVQLGLVGDILTGARRPFPVVAPFENSAEHVFFPETSHGLHLGFLDYWRSQGGLDSFGYPISEEMPETNDDGSGRSYTVQYFQRARFEYHPELPEPYQISLGLLGDQLLIQRLWLR